MYGPSENGEYYPSEALTGKGTVNGRTVNCITPFSGWCNSTPATGSWPAPHFSDDRRASVHDRSEERRHRPDETLDLALAKTVAEVPHPLRVGLHPERPVRVAPHLGHVWVAQGGKRRGAELAAELGIQPLLLLSCLGSAIKAQLHRGVAVHAPRPNEALERPPPVPVASVGARDGGRLELCRHLWWWRK